MKKLLCLLLAVLILVPAGVLAEAKDPAFYYGTWIRIEESNYAYSAIVLHLQENGVALFISGSMRGGRLGKSKLQLRSWSVTENGIQLSTEAGTMNEYKLYTDDQIGYYIGTWYYGFSRVREDEPKEAEQAEPVEMLLNGGVYTVGEDIPAGNYTVTAISPFLTLRVHKNYEAYEQGPYGSTVFSKIMSEYDTTIGKLTLKEGYVLAVDAQIKLATYTGVDAK